MTEARMFENLRPGVRALILPWSRSRFVGETCVIREKPQWLDVEDQGGLTVRDFVCIVATSQPPKPGRRWGIEARALPAIDGEPHLTFDEEEHKLFNPREG